jgi:hypothetical protein
VIRSGPSAVRSVYAYSFGFTTGFMLFHPFSPRFVPGIWVDISVDKSPRRAPLPRDQRTIPVVRCRRRRTTSANHLAAKALQSAMVGLGGRA